MTDTSISDAVVFPEDDGTGVPDGSEDYDSAGHFGLLSQHQGGTYVGNGLDFTNIDTTNETVDISSGHAFVEFSSVTVQSGSGSTYDRTLPDPIVMTIVLPSSVTLSLDSDATNDVYLATDPTNNDGAYLRHGSAVSEPTDPSVYLGTVNTSDGSTTRQNDNASPTYDTVTSNSLNTDDGEFSNSITDPSGATITGPIPHGFPQSWAHPSTNTAVGDGASTKIPLDTVVEDELGAVDTTNNKIVIQDAGPYLIAASAYYQIGGGTDCWYRISAHVNGSGVKPQGGGVAPGGSLNNYFPAVVTTLVRDLSAGDEVELYGYNQSDTGNSIDAGGADGTHLRVVRLNG